MNEMKIEWMPIDAVKPYKNNPRNNEEAVEPVANSIKEFGWQQPIVVDKNNEIIVGHTRLKASQYLGLKTVPVMVADWLTEDQVKAYRIADNKTGELALWDFELLNIELDDIEIDMDLFGFNMGNVELNVEDNEISEDDYSEQPPTEPKSKYGDMYKLGDHVLLCGDSTKEADIKRLIGNNKIHLLLTDPPYGVDVVSDTGKVGADFGVAEKGNYIAVKGDDTTETAQANYNIVKNYADKQIIFGGNYFTEFLPFSDGWVVWDKRIDSGIRNTFADGEMAWCNFHTPVRIYHQLWNGMIREGEHEKRIHPTQKPVRMLGEIINDFTDENEAVLDCFGGSGSVLIACEQTNRRCFMIEYEPQYIDLIIDRWEKLTGRTAEKLKI